MIEISEAGMETLQWNICHSQKHNQDSIVYLLNEYVLRIRHVPGKSESPTIKS